MTPLSHDLWLDSGPGGPHDDDRDQPAEPDDDDWDDDLDRMPDTFPFTNQP